MIITYFQIAEISIRIESTNKIPQLHDDYFNLFRINNLKNADIKFYFKKVPLKSKRAVEINPKIINWLTVNGTPIFSDKRSVSDTILTNLEFSLKVSYYIKQFSENFFITYEPEMILIRDFQKRELWLFYTEKWGNFGPENQINHNLRSYFATFYPCFSSFILHSSAVVENKMAAIFLGVDNSGKTTVAMNAEGRSVLNEDQVIVKKEWDVFYAYSTPFAYVHSSPMKVKIGALFMLEKSNKFHLTPIKSIDFIQCIWHENKRYTHFLPKKYRVRSFNLLTDLCFSVPVYKMHFPKNYIDWDAVDRAMKK